VIENHLGPHYADLRPEPHDGIVLGRAAWSDHQARLIRDRRGRRRLAKRGRRWAPGQLIEQHADEWEHALAEAIERNRQTQGARRTTRTAMERRRGARA